MAGRKEKKAGLPTMGLVSIALLCVFGAVVGCGYLWNKGQIDELGKQIRYYEMRLEEARRKRLTLDRTYTAMCSPADLDDRVRRMGLELGPPQPDQIVRLPDAPAAAPENKLFARRPLAGEEGRN